MMIFEDPSRRRWRFALVLALALCAFIGGTAYTVLRSVKTDAVLMPLPAQLTRQTNEVADETTLNGTPAPAQTTSRPHGPEYPNPLAHHGFLRTAFLVQSDPKSVKSLSAIGAQLDIVMPDYFSFSTANGAIDDHIDWTVQKKLVETGAGIMPRISNTDSQGTWHSREVSRLLRNNEAQAAFISNLIAGLTTCDAIGVNLDIESLEPADETAYIDFIDVLAQALHRRHLYLTVDVPMNENQYDYEAIGHLADAVVLMAYDQHFPTSKPGPVAGYDWFNDGLAEYVQRIEPEKLIVALGTYGYDWTAGQPADALSYDDALALASRHNALIQTDAEDINSTFAYTDHLGKSHEVWFLDAISVWNQYARINDQAALGIPGEHIGGVSMWRLGFEDPAVWDFLLSDAPTAFNPQLLAELPSRNQVRFYGSGEMFRVRRVRRDGERPLTLRDGYIVHAEYTTLPEDFEVDRTGTGADTLVALTFDDGPDPQWTPQLLDILKAEQVPAAFFVVGRNVERHPDIVRREVAEGHLLGNHTFNHPRLETLSAEALHNELNFTQRAVELACDRQMLLFRSPYDTDASPSTLAQLQPLSQVGALGYICVGANADAADYKRLPAAALVDHIQQQFKTPGPHIICFHDGGGDRSQMLLAVRTLIPQLRKQGYQFVGLDSLSGSTPIALNPKTPQVEAAAASHMQTYTRVRSTGWTVISTIFIVSTIIGVIRIGSLGIIMLMSFRKRRKSERPAFSEPVTVIVPAYNEEKVIERTVRCILASDYPDLSVLVVDDGSTDSTAALVQRLSAEHPRVALLTKPNSGKSYALNLAFRKATTDIIVILDADTIVLPHTITALVSPFADPAIDAVCGNVQVGNVNNLLTAMQDVEYVTCQNYDRRAFDALNCIGVVPGATGAWRRKVVLEAGGYAHDTLTEDADLTLEVLSRGGRIVYAPEARSITEAPETVKALYRQRFRWSYGTYQTLWKHRRLFFKGTVGWVGMPNMAIFQMIFPMLAPIGDAVLLYALLTGDWHAIVSGYFTFLAMDLLGSIVAFKLDRRPILGIWSVLIQRFCYRQFMYIVTFSAFLAAIRGGRHGWNKLDRLASVQHDPEHFPPEIRVIHPPALRSAAAALDQPAGTTAAR